MSEWKCPKCSGAMEKGGRCPACGYEDRESSRTEPDYIIPGRDALPGSDPHKKEGSGGYAGAEDFVFSSDEDDKRYRRKKWKKRMFVIAALVLVVLTAVVFYLLKRGERSGSGQESDVRLRIGQIWTVEEQWSLTVNSVVKTEERSPGGEAAADVYIIDYTYTNLSYNVDNPDSWGLYFDLAAFAKDVKGEQCSYYDLDGLTAPAALNPGESVTCQQAIAVAEEGGFTLIGSKYTDKSHGSKEYFFEFTWVSAGR